MSGRPDFLHPDFEPGEFDRIERQLRRALTEDSARITPSNRLDTILHEAHEAGSVTSGGSGRRWLMPVAAAATVAAIAGGLLWSNQDDPVNPVVPGTTPTSQPTTPSVTDSPTSAPSGTPTSSATSSTGAPITQSVSLPVYFVGPVGGDQPTYKLFREFIRGTVPTGATEVDRVEAALALAMNAQPYSNTDGYLQPWSGHKVTSVTVTAQVIEIQLSGPGAEGFEAETQRLAVQELVWTAQAAISKQLPVRFEIADGSTKLFGSISIDQTFNRPAKEELWKDVAPIWISSPSRDQVLPAAKPVTVTGLAIVFEANVTWQLDKGRTMVKEGFETASMGAPMQGEYSIALGVLTPGDYSISVRELSAKDGSVAAEKTVFFSVK